MHNEDYDSLILKSLTATISTEEQVILDKWLVEPENQQRLMQWQLIWENQPEEEVDIDHFLVQQQRLEDNLRIVQRNEILQFRTSIMYRNVAIITLIIVSFTVGIAWLVTKRTQIPETEFNDRVLSLADGTKVTLNQGAKLSFNQTKNTRHVRFQGEAFFDVAKDKNRPFVIDLPRGKISVIGTSFFVKAYVNDTAQVVVTSGIVQLTGIGKTIQLVKNEMCLVPPSGNGYKTTLIVSHNSNPSHKRRLTFENVTLRKIIPLLIKEYSIKIDVKTSELLGCRFSGTFDDESIVEVLNVMSRVMNFSYHLEDGEYIIDGQGCSNK